MCVFAVFLLSLNPWLNSAGATLLARFAPLFALTLNLAHPQFRLNLNVFFFSFCQALCSETHAVIPNVSSANVQCTAENLVYSFLGYLPLEYLTVTPSNFNF